MRQIYMLFSTDTMRIDRLLLLGIVTLAFVTVLATATLLTLDMLRMSKANRGELQVVANSVTEQNNAMLENLNQQASEVGPNINDITAKAAFEQLRNVGDGITTEIKAIMDAPFASVQAMATTLLFAKTEAESSRTRVF